MANKNTVGQDILIRSAIITADRELSSKQITDIDVTSILVELKLYETTNRLHIIGEVAFSDQSAMLRAINFKGSERLTITLSPAGVHNIAPITRTFIIRGVKLIKDGSFYVLDLIDEIGYQATTKVFSKSYTGSIPKIINEICTGNLNKGINVLYNDLDNSRATTHVVIPYMNTYQAVNWLLDRQTTTSGSPYFVAPSLYNNDIKIYNLDAALKSQAVNIKNPFIKGQRHKEMVTTVDYEGSEKAYSCILSVIEKQTDSMHNLSLAGALGVNYSITDLNSNEENQFNNTGLNSLLTLKAKDIIQSQDVVDTGFVINGEYQVVTPAAGIHQIFDEKTYVPAQSYAVDADRSVSVNKLNNKTLKNAINQKTITITMPGTLFATYKLVIGNKLALKFENSEALDDSINNNNYDSKLTGDYIITNIVHKFADTAYNVTADVVKLIRD